MGSSKGWSIFALLIGICGLGLSGYTLFFALPEQTQQEQAGFQNVWHVSSFESSVWVYNFDIVIPDLSIIATVNPGEKLHVLFNADVYVDCDGDVEYLRVHVSLNGIKYEHPRVTVGAWHDHKIWEHITLQYSNFTISPGMYNISIIATSTDSINPNSLSSLTLLAFPTK
ncbi:hypothetical protein LCGC14_0551650 [marine sediment metagenome]|uniref:Carbohydrate binding module xylan-binding domain-containing protein n=1 Tax=marine sediment metagenome TaxID=412755 RepID=A0A0F9UB40_9ZZZZ